MNAQIEKQAQALLDLIEADRARQCGQILGEATGRAAALLAQAHADARDRMRHAFAEQRSLRSERIAAAQARLATHRRLHEQHRVAALLSLAWEQLPHELLALWQQADTRAQWVARIVASALERMPRGAWRIAHAPDWPASEQQTLARTLHADAHVELELTSDAAVAAGLKIIAGSNVIDGTLAGLLADRAEFEARLLRRLEATS